MSASELQEMQISELLDGDLEGESILETVDLLLANEDLRQFYLKGRALDKRLAEVRIKNNEQPMSGSLWDSISTNVGWRRPRLIRGPWRFALAAAALLMLVVGFAFIDLQGPQVIEQAAVQESKEIKVNFEAKQAEMTDFRFVSLALHFLRRFPPA